LFIHNWHCKGFLGPFSEPLLTLYLNHEALRFLVQRVLCNQMELWAKSVERRSLELTRTNRQLRSAVEKTKKVHQTESLAALFDRKLMGLIYTCTVTVLLGGSLLCKAQLWHC